MGNAKSREHTLNDGTVFRVLSGYDNYDYKKCFKKLTKKYPYHNIITAKDDSYETLLKNIYVKKNAIYIYYDDTTQIVITVLLFAK